MTHSRKPFTKLRTLANLRALTDLTNLTTHRRNGRTTEAADAASTCDETLEADGAPTFGLRHA